MSAPVLTATGKIIADLRIFALGDRFLTDTNAAAAPGLRATFTKYINPRFATVTDVTDTLHTIGVFGDTAREIVSSVLGVSTEVLAALSPYAHVTTESAYGTVIIARVPELHLEGYDLFVDAGHDDALTAALTTAGATPSDTTTWHTLRVAAGRPEWGIDMDDNTLPQEANFDELQGVSYTKGCYVGQETVARIHFRGHVNRTLRRLRLDADLPKGTELTDTENKPVGDIRSTAHQPDGTWLAIGMIRREFDTGATLHATTGTTVTLVHIVGPAKI
jgi:folate-binding protein YgfZ